MRWRSHVDPRPLNNRIASVQRAIEEGDVRPTQQLYDVFKELSADLERHLAKLQSAIDGELAELNRRLKAAKLETIPNHS